MEQLRHNIKTDLGEIGWGGMDWINLAQNRDQWQALVKMITFWYYKMLGNSCVAEQLAASQEGFIFME
jgi:hypothetical protein